MLFLLTLNSALAWKHTGWVWDDFPLDWYMDDGTEESLPEGYDQEVIELSWESWLDAQCADFAIEGQIDRFRQRRDIGVPDAVDGVTGFYWNDPRDQQGAGILGVTYTVPTGYVARVANGRTYYVVLGSDIVFNDNVDYATVDEIAGGACSNETSIKGVATHEIGHLLGMDHSCEQGEACPDPVLQEATMFWSVGACDAGQDEINEDDISGMNALYGPSVSFTGSTRLQSSGTVLSGAAPLEVDFSLVSEDDVTIVEADWSFGDGNGSADLNPSYTYNEAGQYTVTVDAIMSTVECGEFNFTTSELGMVTACAEPKPLDGAGGLFQVTEVEGLRWQTINQTDMSVYGCVDMIFWQVYKGGSVDAANLLDLNGDGEGDMLGAWSPELEFPSAGTYTVVVNVGGPAGTIAQALTIEVSDKSGGCSTAGAPGAFGVAGLLAGIAGLAIRRRKQAA